ncbi:MAG: hypothetical protein D6677_01480 [Calditrichaeota bacterium]|nr:MAG: hypothetical protein D6677_01480 [Calditrichota bacterium]
MALWSCENAADPGKDKVEPVVLEPTQEVISSEVENVAALAINMQTKVITDYQSLKADENKPSLQKSANPDKVYRWNPETMWHTWEDDLENAAYPDAFYGHYKRGQQHIDAQGNVVKKPDNAIGIYFYYLTFGKWGYVNDEPTGTSWDHNMSTEANPGIAIITPDGYLFSGDANYHTTWDGYYTDNSGTYNNTLVRFETKVNMNVEELLISMDGTSAQLYGTLHFEMLPWTADLSANGEDTISGTLKYNGVDVAPLSFSVAELMQKAQSLLP